MRRRPAGAGCRLAYSRARAADENARQADKELVWLRLADAFAKFQMSGSKATLLPPCPLRTRRASFPAARSSLSNALSGTRLAAFTILAWSRRTFRVGGRTNGKFPLSSAFPP